MKKYIFIIAAITLFSCKKELNTSPTDAISDQVVFSNISNAEEALNGIYRALYIQYAGQSEDGQGAMMINIDWMGDDVVHTAAGTSYFREAYKWNSHRDASSALTYFAYRFYYIIISNANSIINNIDAVEGETSEKNRIKAEALSLRAWGHFYLVQLFGERYDAGKENTQLGVPIMTTSNTDAHARNTVEEVYTQINADLDAAITLFGDAAARTAKTHFNLNVAEGLKARVALTMQDYATAASYAMKALNGFPLMTNTVYMAGFTDISNNEWMWGINQLADQLYTYGTFYTYMSANFYSSSHTKNNPKAINKLLYAKITATDVRKGLWDSTGKNTAFPIVNNGVRKAYMHRKYLVADINSTAGAIPYMRAAEMYLIAAEALAREGGHDAEAAEALYTLAVNRDPQYQLTTSTGTALLNEIMVQRRVELWAEGFRFLDLKRTNSALDRTNSNHTSALANILSVDAGDKRWQFLIPDDEMNANSLMEQNPL
ncbi:RagB/SusD family nutrient uptake outer membrane protein [[Flexibacter] sp. ATCC 35208]|uniref:RagB/SusD family nutrient uptake outer membrane protein n=1 Tax=[Flexibacter] sp. ATCC 35208 TaxID=1936242 RepID=UPI0009D55531|nr:RagB/SusD family nutrient uptake outer membrane protein [[Flexibacter] sp. ATCC 35208]OMP77366.1 hypothetical protein BW716_20050 [[Flexibacter] sp. ATCC 35208]